MSPIAGAALLLATGVVVFLVAWKRHTAVRAPWSYAASAGFTLAGLWYGITANALYWQFIVFMALLVLSLALLLIAVVRAERIKSEK
ncbi:hypothetical protein GF324_11915 [bacterium]|nr:hypothetical protein [bacterium]